MRRQNKGFIYLKLAKSSTLINTTDKLSMLDLRECQVPWLLQGFKLWPILKAILANKVDLNSEAKMIQHYYSGVLCMYVCACILRHTYINRRLTGVNLVKKMYKHASPTFLQWHLSYYLRKQHFCISLFIRKFDIFLKHNQPIKSGKHQGTPGATNWLRAVTSRTPQGQMFPTTEFER